MNCINGEIIKNKKTQLFRESEKNENMRSTNTPVPKSIQTNNV